MRPVRTVPDETAVNRAASLAELEKEAWTLSLAVD
jgi:hypothetical protein